MALYVKLRVLNMGMDWKPVQVPKTVPPVFCDSAIAEYKLNVEFVCDPA